MCTWEVGPRSAFVLAWMVASRSSIRSFSALTCLSPKKPEAIGSCGWGCSTVQLPVAGLIVGVHDTVQGVFFCSVWRPRWRPPTPPKASTRHTQHTSDPKEGALQAKRDRGGDAHLAAALQPAASTAAAARCRAGTRRATAAARTSGVERAARGREVHSRPAHHSSGSHSIAPSTDTAAPQVHVAQNARPRRVQNY